MFEKRKEAARRQDTAPQQSQSANSADGDISHSGQSMNSRSSAVIGKTIKIKGTVSGDENLIVEGTIEGSVQLPSHDLTIGTSGQVTADLEAKTVRVDGQVSGDISGGEKVIVSKTGHVLGNIVAPRVTLEDGAKFKGSIDMDPGEAASKPKPKVVANDKEAANASASDTAKAS